MKDKVREVCIYRKKDNGEIRPRIYRRYDRDWKYDDKADFLADIMLAFVLTFLFTFCYYLDFDGSNKINDL